MNDLYTVAYRMGDGLVLASGPGRCGLKCSEECERNGWLGHEYWMAIGQGANVAIPGISKVKDGHVVLMYDEARDGALPFNAHIKKKNGNHWKAMWGVNP